MQKQVATDSEQLTDWRPIAARLNLGERAFWKAVHDLGLPAFKINGRVWRFRMADVEAWLAERRTGV